MQGKDKSLQFVSDQPHPMQLALCNGQSKLHDHKTARPDKVQSISKPDLDAAARRAQVGVQSKRVLRKEAIPERKPPAWVRLAAPVRTEKAYALQLPGVVKRPEDKAEALRPLCYILRPVLYANRPTPCLCSKL